MLKRLLLALALILPAWTAYAVETAVVVSSCGSPPTAYIPGQSFAVTQDTTGTLCSSGGSSGGATAVNVQQLNGNTIDLGAGTVGAGTQRTTQASDSPVAVGVGAPADAAWTTGSGSVIAVSKAIDRELKAGTVSLGPATEANSIPTVEAKCLPYTFVTTASTNSQQIGTSTVRSLCDIQAFNTTTTISYLRLYDASAAPTCSSATGFINSYPIPPASAAGGVGGFSIPFPSAKSLTNGLGYCVTGGGDSTNNTNGQAGIYINADYRTNP